MAASEKIMPRRVLIFGNENCGLIHNLCKGFNELGGYTVNTAICQADPFFSRNKYDYNFQRPQRISGNKYFTKIKHLFDLLKWRIKLFAFENLTFFKYDLYIFTWQSFRADFSDLKILREKGKDIVFLFIGSDVRWIEAFHQEFPDNPYKGNVNEDWVRKFKLMRMGELYASSIFSVPDQSTLFIRGYYHMFMPIDINGITFSPIFRKKPLIIHAPSKRDIKGTGIILNAIEQLRKEGVAFDFELLENLDNQTILRRLEQADILVDQLFLHGPATLSTEAMASGCAVATRYFKQYELTNDASIYYIDEKSVLDGLRQLIQNIELRKTLVYKAKDYVATHNSFVSMASKIVNSIQRDKNGDFDYYPNFFINKFTLPPTYSYPDEIAVLNQIVASKYS